MSNLGLLGKNSNVLSKSFRILDSGNQSKSETNPRARYLESIQILCPAHFKVRTCFSSGFTPQIGWPSLKEAVRMNLYRVFQCQVHAPCLPRAFPVSMGVCFLSPRED